MTMNQAQALSSVNYRILRTISLNQHFYIIHIAYSNMGTVCLSFTNISHQTNPVPQMRYTETKYVKLAISTGSFIDVLHDDRFHLYLFSNGKIQTYDSFDDYCQKRDRKFFPFTPNESPFKPHRIAVCISIELLVCLWNRKFKEKSAGKVIKLTKADLEIVLEIESDKNIPLFVCPTYIAENDNGDICVSDVRAVVVTDAGGMLRFRYQGNSRDVDPYGICCNSSCNIIVADMKNNKLHVIDEDGAFLHHVSYDGIKMSRAICIDENNNLYVGKWHADSIKVIAR